MGVHPPCLQVFLLLQLLVFSLVLAKAGGVGSRNGNASSLASTPSSAEDTRRLLVQQAFPGAQAVPGGLVLPLSARHNVARGRGLRARAGVLPVGGSLEAG